MEPQAFTGTERFSIRRLVGEGAMGVVYEALDQESSARVALKTLRKVDGAGIAQLKREFRGLANIVHPNLVGLHELCAEDGQWFFTMDFVEGKPFLRSVQEQAPAGREAFLREVLRQLAEGIQALHQAGKLHCDLKPSNVLVRADGQVIILDFGLARDLAATASGPSDEEVSGTPGYMAPEQAQGKEPTASSDWYALGAMLYEALTGELPFEGLAHEVLFAKQYTDPLPPHERAPGVPQDLSDLCVELLRREAALRPSGMEILRRLGDGEAPSVAQPPVSEGGFVGRAEPLRVLEGAMDRVRRGEPAALFVHGPSGIGKSALVQRFLDDLHRAGDVLILQGRCYERESVPYKAFDSLVDALASYLSALEDAEAAALMPRDIHLLGQIFPALEEVPAARAVPRRSSVPPEPRELRQRAFAALRELFGRIADKQPLALSIDDLQWGDLDSARLLAELLGPPDRPSFLFIGCYRSEDVETSPLLGALFADDGAAADSELLALDPLGEEEAARLASELCGDEAPNLTDRARAIARESGGHPYFVAELVRDMAARSAEPESSGEGRGTSLSDLIRSRVARLHQSARRLLELIVTAGHPLAQGLALEVAGLDPSGQGVLTLLRSSSFVRTRGPRREDTVEAYHDRIREAVAEKIAPQTGKEYHLRLALALERGHSPDPEKLAVHFAAADEPQRAAGAAVQAADAAARILAFDHAAKLYRMALSLLPEDDDQRIELRVKLGEALVHAGRGAEAAREYLAVAEQLGATDRALDLRRRAAEQLLMAGFTDQGRDVLGEVYEELGLSFPRSTGGVVASLAWGMAKLRLRGTRFRPSGEGQIDQRALLRLDALESGVLSFNLIETLRTADLANRQLLLALRLGEPKRISMGLATQGPASCLGGSKSRRADRVVDQAEALATEAQDPRGIGYARMMRGCVGVMTGHWQQGLHNLDRAEALFRERGVGTALRIVGCRHEARLCLWALGELREFFRRGEEHLKEAIELGNRFAELELRILVRARRFLAEDDPERARREIRSLEIPADFFYLNLQRAVVAGEIEVYRGDGAAASESWTQAAPALEGSLLLKIALNRVDYARSRGRAALAASERDPSLLSQARKMAKVLGRSKFREALPAERALRAGIAGVGGARDEAAALLEQAAAAYDDVAMKIQAAACRRQRGLLVGGEVGTDLVRAADLQMRDEGIVNPERWAAMSVPGFDGPRQRDSR